MGLGHANDLFSEGRINTLGFDIESDNFIATKDFAECDAVPITGRTPSNKILHLLKCHPNKMLFVYVVSHVTEGDYQTYEELYNTWSKYSDNVCVITTDYNANNTFSRAHFYDFLFNRHKAYYIDYNLHVKDSQFMNIQSPQRLWSGPASSDMYVLPEIVEHIDINCYDIMTDMMKFIIPNKNDIGLCKGANTNINEKNIYRHLFLDYVRNHKDTFAHYSDWSVMPPQTLECQEPGIMNPDGSNFGGWYPVANHYYDTSIINAYVETLVNDNQTRYITEKTFEPMIKGNFILPFGYQGLVSDIVEQYGFRLPSWIDYSYDSEPDNIKRFYLYTREFLRLRDNLSLENLVALRNSDFEILQHNRRVFFERPYHSLYNILNTVLDTQNS